MPILPILGNNIAFSYLDPPPPPKKGGEGEGSRTFKKLSHLGGGVPKVLLERRDNPKKGGGVAVKMGGCHFFLLLYSSIEFTVCGVKK